MKRIILTTLTIALVFSIADLAQAGPRRSRQRGTNRGVGVSVQLGTMGYGYGPYSTLPSYRNRSLYGGYGGYNDRCYDRDYDRLMYYHQRSRSFSYPQYDYGYGGGGAFDGSRNGGNYWYWRSQQAGNGNGSWGQLYSEMYGGR